MNSFSIVLIGLIFILSPDYSWGQAKMKKIASLDKKIYETSGLVLYKNKYLITHNDGGHGSNIYVMNLNGKLIKKIDIDNAKNVDWEDLTQDDEGRLYIGDFGNNDNDREKNQIYVLPKKFMEKNKVDAKKITFSYEDQKKFPPKKHKLNYDCEAFFWKDDQLYLFTKCRTKPFTSESRIYVVPDKPGKYKAKYIGSLFLCNLGWRFCSITSADYHAKTNTLAILTYSKVYLISNFEGDNFWGGDIKSYALPLVKQREAICFKNSKKLYMTDEVKKGLGGGNLYEVSLNAKK